MQRQTCVHITWQKNTIQTIHVLILYYYMYCLYMVPRGKLNFSIYLLSRAWTLISLCRSLCVQSSFRSSNMIMYMPAMLTPAQSVILSGKMSNWICFIILIARLDLLLKKAWISFLMKVALWGPQLVNNGSYNYIHMLLLPLLIALAGLVDLNGLRF